MRIQICKRTPVLAFCALALLVSACERTGGTPPASQAGSPAAPPPAPASATDERQQQAQAAQPSESSPTPQIPQTPEINEMHPQPQSVQAAQQAEAPSQQDLREREGRVAEREAALAARERRLRQGEDAGNPAVAPLPSPPLEPSQPASAEPAPEPPAPVPPAEERPARSAPVTVAAGTSFEVEFAKGLASNTSSVGDTFRARVISDVMQDGAVAIPAGSEVLGVVTDAAGLRRIGGQAKLALSFTDLVLPSGATVPIQASFLAEGRSKAGKDAATIGGTAAGGAILGRILGQANRGKGTIIGAIIGAAAGTAIASRSAGEEVVIPEGSVIHIQLTDHIDIRPP